MLAAAALAHCARAGRRSHADAGVEPDDRLCRARERLLRRGVERRVRVVDQRPDPREGRQRLHLAAVARRQGGEREVGHRAQRAEGPAQRARRAVCVSDIDEVVAIDIASGKDRAARARSTARSSSTTWRRRPTAPSTCRTRAALEIYRGAERQGVGVRRGRRRGRAAERPAGGRRAADSRHALARRRSPAARRAAAAARPGAERAPLSRSTCSRSSARS